MAHGEDHPLVGGSGKAPSRVFLYILAALFTCTLATTIVFAVLYAKADKGDNPPPVPPVNPSSAYDHSNDFPLHPPAPWNILENHTRVLDFVTTSGTWLNIDVSKDGTLILFDLLGDIYTLPVAGGTATPKRQGVAFETQARYSPDGKKILFTSDLSGIDNIWVLDIETSTATQVTWETYHFVSNAYWIDDHSIVAVKWYTSTRSIGAGEIWIYNITSVGNTNPGVQAVGRSSLESQVGPEEPFFFNTSTSDHVIFYSKNIADGSTWTYSKDPHKTIYIIYQYSLTTKQTTVISSGPGGAARPIAHNVPTPKLAFIKRTLFKTSLMLHDLNTGNEVVLWDNLDFDQQESSAPAGIYPGFAFTPDGTAIIVWAQGQIYRVDVATGVATPIPFSVNVHLELSPTVRSSHPIGDSSTFATKIATSPSVSGNKQIIAFTSLATTYIYRDGVIAPLYENNVNSPYQFWPSLSNDNHYLVHIIWDDQKFASIEVVAINDTTKRYTVPVIGQGRYIQPRFSPAGDHILYVRIPSDALSGPTYDLGSGVYHNTFTVTATGDVEIGPPVLLATGASSVSYSSTGKSIFASSGSYPLSVSEVQLDNSGKVSAVSNVGESLYSTEISVSPDKKHVVFIEFQKVYFTKFELGPTAGKPMNITAITKGGVASASTMLSSVGGSYLTWSYDSSTVYWVWGPTLYEASVATITACGNDKICIAENVITHNISVTVPSDVVETQIVVFDNVTIFTMENDTREIPDGRIVVTGSRITDLGPRDSVPIPEGAKLVDVANGYVLPGLIDAHAHWSGSWEYFYKVKADWEMFVNLAFGVTTLHNPSADTLSVFADAELIRAGKKIGPRVFSTGSILYGAGGTLHCDITSYDEAKYYVSILKEVGAWSVKSYNQPARAARQMILQAARELELNVVPEGGMSYYWNLNQIIDGHTTLEHSIPMAPLYNDVITAFSASGTAWTPTLIVNYGGIFGERYWYQYTKVWEEERLLMYVPKDVVEPLSIRYDGAHEDVDYHHFDTSRAAATFNLNGGYLNTGAHGQMQGIGIHWELKMINQSGLLSPYEVLQTATINPARALGLYDDIGSLKVGKLADLIFYNSTTNPLDIENTPNVMWVFKDGHLYSAPDLNQILPEPQTRPALPQLNVGRVNNN